MGYVNERKLQNKRIKNLLDNIFLNPETTTGGRSLKFYSSVRLDVRRIETVKLAGESVANRVKVKVVKNKVAPPFKEAQFEITFGKGIDQIKELVEIGVEIGAIKKAGAWFNDVENPEIKCQGLQSMCDYVSEHPEYEETLRAKCINQNTKESDF